MSQSDLDERRARRVRGRQGPRAHARAALRHERLRGRARVRDAGRRHGRVPPPGPHRPPVPVGRRSTTWRSRSPRTRSARRRSRRSRANGLKSCYIRPLVFRGAGPMGLYPLDCPVDVMIAVWEWGAYLGDEGKVNGVRAKVSSWRRISARRADPDGQGRRPVPELDPGQDRGRQGRLRGGDPARLARLRLRGHGREPVPGQGRQGRPRRASPTTSSRASTARRRSRSCATRATRSSSATSPAASSTAPTRSS